MIYATEDVILLGILQSGGARNRESTAVLRSSGVPVSFDDPVPPPLDARADCAATTSAWSTVSPSIASGASNFVDNTSNEILVYFMSS